FVQYFKYLGSLFSGDWGETFNGTSVGDMIANSYPITLRLALIAVAIEAVIGLAAGIMTGLRGKGFLDNLVLVSTTFLISLPVFTFLGTDLGALMGGAIVTEGVFNINGLGGLIFRGIQNRESATVVGVVVLLVMVYLLMSLIVDLLYAVLDPRIRYD